MNTDNNSSNCNTHTHTGNKMASELCFKIIFRENRWWIHEVSLYYLLFCIYLKRSIIQSLKKVQRHIYQINHFQMSGKCHIFPEVGHLIGLENIKMRQWILRFWWSQSSASCTFTINLIATSPHFFSLWHWALTLIVSR